LVLRVAVVIGIVTTAVTEVDSTDEGNVPLSRGG
jgi:hypothetical protein